ncbi:hypothetical protein Peur_026480 [Populus x canadensis]
MFWESEDLGFHFSIQTSLHQLLRRQAVIHCSSFLIHTVQPLSHLFLNNYSKCFWNTIINK